MVDYRNAIFVGCAALFILPGILLLALDQALGSRDDDDLEGTAFGLLAVGGLCFFAFLANCGGLINRDERELFGEQPTNALSN